MNTTVTKWTSYFASAAGTLLLSAALVRFLIAAGDSQLLTLPDPLLGVPLKLAVLFVGLMELAVALICLFGNPGGLQTVLVVWLAMNWVMYRIGLLWAESNMRDSALGSLTDPLRLAGSAAGRLVQWVPAALLVWALALVLVQWKYRKKECKINYLKIACPSCGGHIEFPTEGIGWNITCPHCGDEVRLQNLPKIA